MAIKGLKSFWKIKCNRLFNNTIMIRNPINSMDNQLKLDEITCNCCIIALLIFVVTFSFAFPSGR